MTLPHQHNSAHNKRAALYNSAICGHINEICSPLFTTTEITNFFYVRIYNDGSRLYLSHRAEWVDHYIASQYYELLEHDYTYVLDGIKNHYALWCGFEPDRVFQDVHEFNVGNGFTISNLHPSYCETYIFAADRNNYKINNFYLNNIGLLQSFILYFMDKAANLLDAPPETLIRLQRPVDNYISKASKPVSTSYNIDKSIQPQRFYINEQGTYLSPKEAICLAHVLRGRSAKKIAEILYLSPRMVEWHINSIKEKACCSTKNELVDFIDKNPFLSGMLERSL